MFKSVRVNRARQQFEEELNLVPFLDVMIVLIPFLMFSASFATIVALPSSLPTPVSEAPKDIHPPFDLVVRPSGDSIHVYLNPASPTAPPTATLVSAPGLDYDQATMDRFHQELVAIKRQFPGETRMALDASPSTNLQRISTLMDLSRTLVPGDTAVPTMVDQKAGSLFPAVALKGVYVP